MLGFNAIGPDHLWTYRVRTLGTLVQVPEALAQVVPGEDFHHVVQRLHRLQHFDTFRCF